MTKYTADDFKNARFALAPDGRTAMRATPNDILGYQWVVATEVPGDLDKRPRQMIDQYKDKGLASLGFEPVQENPRLLTADDITDEMVNRARKAWNLSAAIGSDLWRVVLAAALTEPTRPEGAEKVEAVLHQYWSGDINGDDLADRIVEEMNR